MEHPLRTYRKNVGLSLQRLAETVGVTKSCLSKIETGAATPSISLAARLAHATGNGVSVSDFIVPEAALAGAATATYQRAPARPSRGE